MSIRAAFPPPSECTCVADRDELPAALLDLTVDQPGLDPPLSVATVGYEQRAWRAQALARHITDWVLDFALQPTEPLHRGNALDAARRAIQATFGNGNDRGVPGEILLHAICRQFFGSDTVIHKVYFKTADNDTYKGFDGVHSVHSPTGGLELWLGEAKFYKNIYKAVTDATAELRSHLEGDYLRKEFAIVAGRIAPNHPHIDELKQLLHHNTSLDVVFSRIVTPVLVTYDSAATERHRVTCTEYLEALENETRNHWLLFKNKLDTNLPVSVRLILLPMANKKTLLDALDEEISRWR